MSRHGSTLCSPTVEKILCRSLFSKRSHIGNLRQIRKQGKGRSSKRKENRRLSFLFAPAAGRGTLPPSADGESPAEVQRKTSRPLGANTPAAVRAPLSAGAEKRLPPEKGEPPARFSFPAQPVLKKLPPRSGEPPARFVCTRQSVQEKVLPGQGVLLRNSRAQHSLC